MPTDPYFIRRITELGFPRPLPEGTHRLIGTLGQFAREFLIVLRDMAALAEEIRRDPDRSDAGRQKALDRLADETRAKIERIHDKHQDTRDLKESVAALKKQALAARGGDLNAAEGVVLQDLRERKNRLEEPGAAFRLALEVEQEFLTSGDITELSVLLRAPACLFKGLDAATRASLNERVLAAKAPELAAEFRAVTPEGMDLSERLAEYAAQSLEWVDGASKVKPFTGPDEGLPDVVAFENRVRRSMANLPELAGLNVSQR